MTLRARSSVRGLSASVRALALVALVAPAAMACGGAGPGSTTPAASAPVPRAARGYAVLARSAQRDAAWSLAQETYRSERLRPRLDEATARVLVGEAAPPARRDLRDVAETRDAIVDTGAPSRKLLASLAKDLELEGILVVSREGEGAAVARLFEAADGTFSPIEVREGEGGQWGAAVASIERLAPRLAPEPVKVAEKPAPAEGKSKAFYESPWFWGAAGAALALGGAFFLATRDSSSDSIHVQMQVPR